MSMGWHPARPCQGKAGLEQPWPPRLESWAHWPRRSRASLKAVGQAWGAAGAGLTGGVAREGQRAAGVECGRTGSMGGGGAETCAVPGVLRAPLVLMLSCGHLGILNSWPRWSQAPPAPCSLLGAGGPWSWALIPQPRRSASSPPPLPLSQAQTLIDQMLGAF